MNTNIYSYEKLIEKYPEDKYILYTFGDGPDTGLYIVDGVNSRDYFTGKIILNIKRVTIVK